jgi:hypothetical protein
MSANLKETLNTYSLSELKKMVSAYNKKVKIGPYTQMKKAELINLMTSDKHRAEFSSVKPKSKAKAEEPKKKIPFKKTGRSGAEVMAEKKAAEEPKKKIPFKKTGRSGAEVMAEKKAEEAPKKKIPFKKTGRSGAEVMAEKKAAEAPKKKVPFKKTGRSGAEALAAKKKSPKKVKVVRKTKGGKVTGGSVDGKDIASN